MSFSPTLPPRTLVPFHDHAQIEILDAAEGAGRTRAPDIVELTNHFGTVHGGVLFSVGEVAAGAAAARCIGAHKPHLRFVTRRAVIDYLKPARGAVSGEAAMSMTRDEIIMALELQPSLTVPIAVAVRDSAGVVVARLTVDMFVGRPKP